MTKIAITTYRATQIAGVCAAIWFVTRALGGPATLVTVGITCTWLGFGVGVYVGVNKMLKAYMAGAEAARIAAAEMAEEQGLPESVLMPVNTSSTSNGSITYRILHDHEEG